jgi:hypothetical protein
VEAFDLSMQTLERLLMPRFPEFRTFPAFANVLRPGKTLADKLQNIRDELGGTLYEELLAENADNLLLHRNILARYSQQPPSRQGVLVQGI